MSKSSRLREYEKGYELITDYGLNMMFNEYLDIIEDNMIDKKAAPHAHYWIFYTDKDMKELNHVAYNMKEIYNLKSKGLNFSKQALKIAEDYAPKIAKKFIEVYPNSIPVMCIFCLSAGFMDEITKKLNNGLLISGQTKDGRCCMVRYKVLMDDLKVCGYELTEEYIPKEHTNDEEYIWEGSVNFFERVAKIRLSAS